MNGIAGRSFVVTGGSRGIGRAIVHRLIENGARVVATGRDDEALRHLVDEVSDSSLEVVAGDVTDRAHQRRVIDHVMHHFGSLDGLVANAGAHVADGPILADDDDGFARTWEVNVLAVRSWVREAASHWTGSRTGAVVSISSIAGVRPEPHLGVYGTTKAAQNHLIAQLARELAPRARVNAVAPGFTLTDTTRALGPERVAQIASAYPMARVASPDDIAGPALFLLSDEASMITGQTLVVDGGFTMTLAGGYVP